MLTEGEIAPAWKGFDQNGKEHSLKDYAGRWLLFYFYPKDDTPGCTTEACGFRDSFDALSKRISIIGVSSDSVESHNKFAKKYSLPFTLIADPEKVIIEAYGTDGLTFPKRVTFLIDTSGTIRKIYKGFDYATHSDEIAADLRSFDSEEPSV